MPPLLENLLIKPNMVEARVLIKTQADLQLRKLIQKYVVLMDATIAHKIHVHDITKSSLLLIMENIVRGKEGQAEL